MIAACGVCVWLTKTIKRGDTARRPFAPGNPRPVAERTESPKELDRQTAAVENDKASEKQITKNAHPTDVGKRPLKRSGEERRGICCEATSCPKAGKSA